MHCSLCLFPISLLDKVFLVVVLDRLFSFGRQKTWLLVALNRWLSYTVTIVWEFAGVDSALVILAEWLSHRGGLLNKFDCNALSLFSITSFV